MIYLTTGANGAGKTLNTLKLVREKQVKEGRSVFYNGFAMLTEKAAEFGWLEFDPRKWQDLPDGAILICDECQNEFPVRATGSAIPEYVRALSEHRRRGFDFFMVTQHPQNLDLFLRRLIGSPGWHRHLKRTFGADMVSVLEWSAVNGQCEKEGSGSSARVTMAGFPKEVYAWYASASLHTGKKSIPKAVYFLAAAAVLIPALFYYAYSGLQARFTKPATVLMGGPLASTVPGVRSVASSIPAVTAAFYVASFVPRVEGLPHTAPRYDEVTKPVVAPFPVGCVSSVKSCECFTAQGTKMPAMVSLCLQILKNGFFRDWESDRPAPDRARVLSGSPGQNPDVALPSYPSAPSASVSTVSASEGSLLAKMRSVPGGTF